MENNGKLMEIEKQWFRGLKSYFQEKQENDYEKQYSFMISSRLFLILYLVFITLSEGSKY